jgi:cytochrome c-type biogenesis protein CcmH/NrfG
MRELKAHAVRSERNRAGEIMGQHPVSAGNHARAEQFRSELLGRLGLTSNASDQDVETTHGELVEFLEAAPHKVQPWAAARTTDADEAFALLSGPEEQLSAAAPSRVAEPPSRPSTKAAQESGPDVTRAAVLAAFKPRSSKVWWAVLPVVLAAVVFGVYNFGGGSSIPSVSGKPTNEPSAAATGPSATVPLDKTKVAGLMQKISANPKDVPSLLALGDTYFAAADYKTSALWEEKVLAIDAKNQSALLALGAARFNEGNVAEAKKQWLVAAGLYPDNAEVHYDLGFLYLSAAPPDMAKVRTEWNKVVAIDPTSAVAKTVATHLKSLNSPSPAASAAPSPK